MIELFTEKIENKEELNLNYCLFWLKIILSSHIVLVMCIRDNPF